MDGANAKIAVTADVYLAGSDELKGQLTYTLDIGPDAQADLTWNLAWKAADATAREAGLRFLLPAAADRMSWFRDSLYTEYPAGHIAAPRGSATSKDAAFSAIDARCPLGGPLRRRQVLRRRDEHRPAPAHARPR